MKQLIRKQASTNSDTDADADADAAAAADGGVITIIITTIEWNINRIQVLVAGAN